MGNPVTGQGSQRAEVGWGSRIELAAADVAVDLDALLDHHCLVWVAASLNGCLDSGQWLLNTRAASSMEKKA